MNNVNSSVGNTSVGEEEYTLYGKPTITEMLRGLTFQISANSFFQTNSHQVWNWSHGLPICVRKFQRFEHVPQTILLDIIDVAWHAW